MLPRGGGVFFHCNTLHASDPNKSPNPRWGLICCYNTKTNGLTFQTPPMSNHPSYDRVGALEIWDDDEVRLSSPSPGFFSQLLAVPSFDVKCTFECWTTFPGDPGGAEALGGAERPPLPVNGSLVGGLLFCGHSPRPPWRRWRVVKRG